MLLRRLILWLCFALVSTFACAATQTYRPQKGTEILWDRYGVPHIFAKSVPDMFFSLGYAQTEAHGDILLHAMGAARGRAAEYFGPGEADRNIRADRWAWTNEVPIRSAQWLAAQTPEFRRNLDAFAAGINAWAMKHPEAISAEVKPVLPITTLDIMEREQYFYNFEFTAGMSLATSRQTRGAVRRPPPSSNLHHLSLPRPKTLRTGQTAGPSPPLTPPAATPCC